MKNFTQDEQGKKNDRQKSYANRLAMQIRDSGKSDGSSASKLVKYYTIDTLEDALAAISNGESVTFNG